MDLTNQIILVVSLVLFASILASVVTSRFGVPLLLVFLFIGMLLGEEGPGGIQFDDVQMAHLFGSLALAIILFDGGLVTPFRNFRVGLKPAVGLATVGVLITAGVTGLFAAWWLGLHWMEGLLLGAIVGSTDAAAVFSLLRSQGLELKQRVGATLEIESGSNDPMAIFLTIVLMELIISGSDDVGLVLLLEFVRQMGLGALFGIIGGLGLVRLINRLEMSPGLYPLAVMAGGLSIFGITSVLQGSGFLAIYLAGLVVGNRPLQSSQYIKRFHDGIARLSQIGMFLMLGLLVTPSELLARRLGCLVVRRGPDPGRPPDRGLALPAALPLSLARAGLRRLGRFARGGAHHPGALPASGRDGSGVDVLQHRLLRGAGVAADPGVDGRLLRPLAGTGGPADQSSGAACRAGYPRPARARAGRLSPGERHARRGRAAWRLAPPEERAGGGGSAREAPGRDPRPGRPEARRLSLSDRGPGRSAELDRLFVASAAPERLSDQVFFGEFVLNGEARVGDLAAAYGLDLPARTMP
jgi:potassium/hydrogen antiporter